MSEKNNGGPAFPIDPRFSDPKSIDEAKRLTEGMTLRDYFAARFMQGWMASWDGPNPSEGGLKLTAETAYAMADAMVKAREA